MKAVERAKLMLKIKAVKYADCVEAKVDLVKPEAELAEAARKYAESN